MENDKYVVWKREDWERMTQHGLSATDEIPVPIQDAIVIRRQDIFAGPGLFAYANAIQTFIEAIDWWSGNVNVWDARQELEYHLQELRDFFADQAQMAVESPSKVPD